MYVDLTPPEPEPQPGAVGPQPVPVEQAPIPLTAREELLGPLRELGTRICTGSPVLFMLILRGLWSALRRAAGAPAPDPAPAPEKASVQGAKADLVKKPADEDEDADGTDEADTEPVRKGPPKKVAAKAAASSLFEQLALGAFVVAITLATLSVVGPALAYVLAPYTVWIILGAVVAWCLTAAHYAPAVEEDETTPVNDHENVAGEQDQEHAPETDPADDWTQRRAAIRRFVEEAVAAGAAGHRPEKGRGATVDSMLAELQQKTPLPGWDRKRLIELLAMIDIPVRDQMKFRVIVDNNGAPKSVPKNLPGVHVEELAKQLGRTPSLPGHLVPDIIPGATPILASVPDPDESLIRALDELPPEAPAEGRSGAA